jgi:hypothetical protein
VVALAFSLCGPLTGELAYMRDYSDSRDELGCVDLDGVNVRVGAQLSVVRGLTDAVAALLEGDGSRCTVAQAYEFLTALWSNVSPCLASLEVGVGMSGVGGEAGIL